jgi:glutamate racemase
MGAQRTDVGDSRPLGVFDSGVGGLTVMRALIDLLPNESFIYFGDTARTPYGPKPADDVVKFSIEISELLHERGVKLLVDACNTSTAVALDAVSERLDVPIVGVIEPGIRAARRVTRSGRVGVIGTVGTVGSGAYERVAAEVAPDLQLIAAACPGFVEFVEAGDLDSYQVHLLAERMLAPVVNAGVDTLVLGCTHYPLLARTISDVMGPDVVLVSSADETAFTVRELLRDSGASAPTKGQPTHMFLTSGDTAMFAELGTRFLGPEVAAVQGWRW